LSSKDAGFRLSPEASGEFGSHAIRPRSGQHMQVMTVEIRIAHYTPTQ